MRAGRTERNAHHVGGFGQRQVVIKNQLQNFALACGQFRQCATKQLLHFRPINFCVWRFRKLYGFRSLEVFAQPKSAQPMPSAFIRSRRANHGKQPRSETGSPVKTRLAFQHFQIHGLQHDFSFRAIVQTTTHRPAKTFAVMLLQIGSQFRTVHRIARFNLFFAQLVA